MEGLVLWVPELWLPRAIRALVCGSLEGLSLLLGAMAVALADFWLALLAHAAAVSIARMVVDVQQAALAVDFQRMVVAAVCFVAKQVLC